MELIKLPLQVANTAFSEKMQGDAEIQAWLADPSVRPPWEFDLEEEAEGGAELSPDSLEIPVYTISEYLDRVSTIYPENSDAKQQSEPSENTAESGEDEGMPGADEVLSAEAESDSSGDNSDSSEGDYSSSESETEEDESPMEDASRQWFEETIAEWTADMPPAVAELAQSRDFRSSIRSFLFQTIQAPVR